MDKLLFSNLGVVPYRPHVAVTSFRPGQVSIRHTHDFFEMFLVTSGNGIHHINRQKLVIGAGHLVVVRPQDCHHFTSLIGTGLTILNIAIAREWWESFHRLMGESIASDWHQRGSPAGHLSLSPAGLREMQRCFEPLGGIGAGPPSDVVEILLRVIGRFDSLNRAAVPPPPEWLERWIMEMRETGDGISEPITYWQKRSRRSPEHLARTCRMFYQSTPTDLLNHLRIERAKRLLEATDGKVISIAFACGFGNLANFYRNFAARTGMTPKAWRRRGAATVPLGKP